MPRRKARHSHKLSAKQVKTIFLAREPADKVAAKFKVSPNLVYLIRARRIHKAVTQNIRKPIRKRRKLGGAASSGPRGQVRIDIDQLADTILKKFFTRLRKAQ